MSTPAGPPEDAADEPPAERPGAPAGEGGAAGRAGAGRTPGTAPDTLDHHARLVTERHLKTGRGLLALLDPPRGASLLELGCGTGLFGPVLAEAVGPRGDVLGLDPSPYHIAIAHQRARRQLRFQVGGIERLAGFPPGCFDGVLAIDGLAEWADPPAVLAALWRVLRPGGRLALAVCSARHRHPVWALHARLMARPPYDAWPAPRPPDADAARLAAALLTAGFADVRLQPQPEPQRLPGVQATLAWAEAASWGRFLAHLPRTPQDLRARALADLSTALLMRRGAADDGLEHRGLRWRVSATRAAA